MINLLLLAIIFIGNIIIIHYSQSLKFFLGGGFELTIIGSFLGGYWFGFKYGFIIGLVFMITSNLVLLDINPVMLVTVPLSGVVGLLGALSASIGIGAASAGIFSSIIYCVIVDTFLVFIYGKDCIFYYLIADVGTVFTSLLFFRVFF